MKKHLIARKLKRGYKALDRTGWLAARSCTAENIHQFRLSYKRINALFTMLTYRKWAKELFIPLKLKKAYKYSGAIRKRQLLAAVFRPAGNKYATLYLKALKSAIEDAKKQSKKRLSSKMIDRSRNKNIAAVKGSFHARDYRKFLVAKLKRIDKAVHRGVITDHKLHTIRKELKGVLYTKRLFKDVSHADRGLHNICKISSGSLLQRLGRFQDQCNAIDLLEPRSYPGLGLQLRRWMKGQRQKLQGRKSKMEWYLSKQLKRKF